MRNDGRAAPEVDCPFCGSRLRVVHYNGSTRVGMAVCAGNQATCSATFWIEPDDTVTSAPYSVMEVLVGQFASIQSENDEF